jgi:hypothetical protein
MNTTVASILTMLTSGRNALSIQVMVFRVVPVPGGSFCTIHCAEPAQAQTWQALAAAHRVTSQRLIKCQFFGKLARFDRKRFSIGHHAEPISQDSHVGVM